MRIRFNLDTILHTIYVVFVSIEIINNIPAYEYCNDNHVHFFKKKFNFIRI